MSIQSVEALSSPCTVPLSLSPGDLQVSSNAARSLESPEKIHKAATDFEALLIAQMLKSTRESGGGMTGDSEETDETNSTMIELGEQQLAQAMSSAGGLGLAKIVIAGLSNHANR